MRIVITHPERGVYLGHPVHLGRIVGGAFWSLLDTGAQYQAVTFASEEEARQGVQGWAEQLDPAECRYVALEASGHDHGATVDDLTKAGLGDELGLMPLNDPAQFDYTEH